MTTNEKLAEIDLIPCAAHFAFCAHNGQERKYNGRPYIEHPMRVAGRVSMLIDCPAYAVAAAWLHDVIEDCPGFVAKLRQLFPAEVVELVEELTNPSHGTDGLREHLKAMDRNHIAKASKWALCIKCIDRMDNLAEMDPVAAGKFATLYVEESKLLASAIGSANTNDDWQVDKLVAELRAALTPPPNNERTDDE